MCSVLGIARSTYYKKLTSQECSRSKENKILKQAILEIYKENKGRYGSPKIHFLMNGHGYKISEKRVQRFMREMNLYDVTVKHTSINHLRKL